MSVESRIVEVSVHVMDKHGNPLPGLTKDNFQIFDDKKLQTIGHFSVLSSEPMAAAADALPPDTYINGFGGWTGAAASVTVILLDPLNTSFLDQGRSRDAILKYLQTIRPEDRVALYILSDKLYVLQDFTSDSALLVRALKKFKGTTSADLDMQDTAFQNQFNLAMVAAAKDAGIRESDAAILPRAQITGTALRTIADHLGGLPGRKNLIWVSADFPFNIETNNIERSFTGEKLAAASESELTVRALLAANVSIYPVDARGLVGANWNDSGVVQATDMGPLAPMRALAARTGGRAYFNRNDVMGSIRDAVNDSRLTYEIGFYPNDVKWDGSFHSIRVKANVPGAQVEAREGYYALGELHTSPEARVALIAEAARGPLDATELSVKARVAPAKSDGDDPKVSVSVTLDLNQFDFEESAGTWNELIEVAFVQLDDKGQIIRTSRQSFPLSLDRTSLDQLLHEGFGFDQDLPIRQGAVQLRVIVRDGGHGKIGSLQIPLGPYITPVAKDSK